VRARPALFAALLLSALLGASAVRGGEPASRMIALQRDIRALMEQLDQVRGVGDADPAPMRRHWQSTGKLLASARPGKQGSVACELSAQMSPTIYAKEMDDVLWTVRVGLAESAQLPAASQSRAIDKVLAELHGHLVALRGKGFRHGRATPDEASAALPESASEGAFLVRAFCTQCHVPPSPALHAEHEWHDVLMRMDTHAGLVNMIEPQSAMPITERALPRIEAYLRQHACDAAGDAR
jgi:hypothetical protein